MKNKNTKKLEIYDEEITTLPEKIGKQTSLTELELRCPKVTKLPESLKNLKIWKI